MIVLALLVACGVPAPEVQTPRRALDDEVYRFCHQAGFDKTAALAYCELLEDLPPEVCPGMRESCTTEVEERRDAGCDGGPTEAADERVPAIFNAMFESACFAFASRARASRLSAAAVTQSGYSFR